MNEHEHYVEVSPSEERILYLLCGKELCGTQMQKAIAEASGGTRRLLPGTLYPVLRSLKEKGLIDCRDGENETDGIGAGQRSYSKLTPKGKLVLDEIKLFRLKLFAWQPVSLSSDKLSELKNQTE